MYNNVLSQRIHRSNSAPVALEKNRLRDAYDHLNVSFATMDNWLKKHRKTPKFKLSELELACTRRWFMSLEQCRSGDGVPTSVISAAFLQRGVFTSKRHADNMIDSIDTDKSGAMSYEEFMAAVDGSNLMQASRLRSFLRSLVKEYPDIHQFYSAHPPSPKKSTKGKGTRGQLREKSSSRVVPLQDDVDSLHFLKSRETMMKMGVKFPPEDEEKVKAPVCPKRPATAGPSTRTVVSTSGNKEGMRISRSFRSDELFDRGHYLLPTLSCNSSPRIFEKEEDFHVTTATTTESQSERQGSPLKDYTGENSRTLFRTLSTATPPEALLSQGGPVRSSPQQARRMPCP